MAGMRVLGTGVNLIITNHINVFTSDLINLEIKVQDQGKHD